HREDAVHHDQSSFPAAVVHEAAQVGSIVVRELLRDAEGEPRAVDDAGVVLFVEIDDVTPLDEARNGPQIDLETGRKRDCSFLSHETGELFLELDVDTERPVQEPASRAT